MNENKKKHMTLELRNTISANITYIKNWHILDSIFADTDISVLSLYQLTDILVGLYSTESMGVLSLYSELRC